MPAKKKSDYAPHIPPEKAPPCHMPGCKEPGAYKAPRSRKELHDYCWFCLEHIREHNKQWDFFEGMDSNEIESFIRDATTGHRPTWSREGEPKQRLDYLQDALYEFLSLSPRAKPSTPALPAKMRKALAAMDMTHPYTAQTLKTQYRALVKKHHPDVNKGDKRSEERFKHIATAYRYLSEQLET